MGTELIFLEFNSEGYARDFCNIMKYGLDLVNDMIAKLVFMFGLKYDSLKNYCKSWHKSSDRHCIGEHLLLANTILQYFYLKMTPTLIFNCGLHCSNL